MNFEILTEIKNCKITRNRNLITDALATYEGKECIIKIEKPKKTRTSQQNRYYWGVMLPIVQRCLKVSGHFMTINDTHELLKLKFLKEIVFIDESTGEVAERIKSTTELSTDQEIEYFGNIQDWTREYFNTEIPDPNEDLTLNF